MRAVVFESRGAIFTVGILFAALLILGQLDVHDPILMILSNLSGHLYVLSSLVGVFMAVLGAWLRGIVLVVLGMLGVALIYSELAPVSQPMSTGSPDIRIIAFNLLGSNLENGAAIAEFLESADADLVFLNESRPLVPYLDQLSARYPFQLGCGVVGDVAGACGDVLVLSRLELGPASIAKLTPASAHQTVTATVDVQGKQVNLVATHFLRPYSGEQQVAEFAALKRLVAGLDGTTVVAGDFNSAAWFGPFASLLSAAGLTRAVFEPGTWPVQLGDFAVPIDHVLVSGGAAFVSLQALPDPLGSNHRGLFAEIALERR